MMQEFVQQVKNMITEQIRGIHTAFPGTILAYDHETGLATVLPAMKFRKPNGTTMDYPKITGVPVVFQQSSQQQVTLAFPVSPGDGCLVVCAEQSLDYWLYEQETATTLAFDMSNAICIPGLFSKPNQVVKDAIDRNAIILDMKGTRISVADGLVSIDAPKVEITGDLTVKGKIL